MAWVEIPSMRVRRGKTFRDRDDENPQRWGRFSIAPLHYELVDDARVFSQEINTTPQRVKDAGGLDGWRITQNGWHYEIGRSTGKQGDGWVGFGGRQGSHWFRFRLARLGYLHWPSRAWQDIGGAPSYDRANLSRQSYSKIVGPNGEVLNLESVARWDQIWTTPNGGSLDINWRVNGFDLKEEIVIDQTARGWITNNRPPSTAPTETWFGFVFQVDWGDIPKRRQTGQDRGVNDDFDDGAGPIELRDAADRLLAFMPLDEVRAGEPGRSGLPEFAPLRKRFYQDGGNHFLLVGVRVDRLAGLRAGALYFDPTFNVAANARDGGSENSGELISSSAWSFGSSYLGRDAGSLGSPGHLDGGWQYVTTVPQGATIDSSSIALDDGGGDRSLPLTGAWWGFDVDSPTDFSASDTHRISDHHTRTTATVTDNINTAGNHTSPSLNSIIQEIVDRAGFSGRLGVTWRNSDTADGWYEWSDYSDSAALAADLTVEWTTEERLLFRRLVQDRRPIHHLRI